MTQGLLLNTYRDITGLLEDLARRLVEAHTPEELSHVTEQSIQAALNDQFRTTYEKLRSAIRNGEVIERPRELEEQARELFAARLHLLNFLNEYAIRCEARNVPAPSSSLLRDAIVRLEQARDGMLLHWPNFDRGDLEAARADADRGELASLDEIFAGAAKVSVERWKVYTASR
jgi:hypothetical protein